MARLFVISGPSGAGKGTLIRGVLELRPDLAQVATSATTRPMRPGEEDGREYFFLSTDEFLARVDADEFVEWVEFAGNRYGTLKSEVDRLLSQGVNVILELEVDGSLVIKEARPEACLIFIDTDIDELRRRLLARQTEAADEIEARLRIAEEQAKDKLRFDHVVHNDRVERAVAELLATLERELELESERPKDCGRRRWFCRGRTSTCIPVLRRGVTSVTNRDRVVQE
ncbi:MAG: guanylate kinase, partial [Gaiellales bacterium]